MKATGKPYSVINGGLFRFGTLLCGSDKACELSINNCIDASLSLDNNVKYLNASETITCIGNCGFSSDEIQNAIYKLYPKKILCGAC